MNTEIGEEAWILPQVLDVRYTCIRFQRASSFLEAFLFCPSKTGGLPLWALVRDASLCSRKREIQRLSSPNAEEELATSACSKRGKSCERLSNGCLVAIILVTSQQLDKINPARSASVPAGSRSWTPCVTEKGHEGGRRLCQECWEEEQ